MSEPVRRLSVLAPAALLIALLAISCIVDLSGPDVEFGSFALAPSFPSGAATVVDVDRVHVVLRRTADSSLALDTTVQMTTSDSVIDLNLRVVVTRAAETFWLELGCYSPGNELVFVAGALLVTATTSTTTAPTPVDVTLSYVGPGHDAVSVEITSLEPVVEFGETIMLEAQALSGSGSPIPGTPVKWISHNTARATVPHGGVGQIRGGSERGTVQIEARLLTGPSDMIDVWVEPVPSEIVVVSGDNQTGVAGMDLPDPVELQVNAVDGPVEGVTVEFTTADGGSFEQASANTDADGYVWATWMLGPNPGEQAATATVAGFPNVQTSFTATASAQVPTQTINWTGAAGDRSWSNPANWDAGRIPNAFDSVFVASESANVAELDVDATVSWLTIGDPAGAVSNYVIVLEGTTLQVDSGATVTATRGRLQLENGRVTGAGDIAVHGQLICYGGTIEGPGAVNVAVGGQAFFEAASGANVFLDGRILTNDGTILWRGDDIIMNNGAQIVNNVALQIEASGAMRFGGIGSAPLFVNNGTLQRWTTAWTTTIEVPAENAGTIQITRGVLEFTDNTNHTGATLEVGISSSASDLVFSAGIHTLDAQSSITVGQSGTVLVSGGRVTVNGTYGLVDSGGRTEIAELGRIDFLGSEVVSLARLELSGLLFSDAPVAVLDSMMWRSNGLSGTGSLTIPDSVVLVLADLTKSTSLTIDNSGTIVHTGGVLSVVGGASINNLPGAIYELRGDNSVTGGTFNNDALLVKTAGSPTGASLFGPVLNNFGVVDIREGTLELSNAGFTHAPGAVLQGSGTFDPSATFATYAGDLNPGTSPGSLEITGDYNGSFNQAVTSTINIEIDGPTAGAGYDQITISGTATFDGALNVVTGFSPVVGDTFAVLKFASRTGHFSSISGLDLGDGLRYDTLWTDTTLVLQVAATGQTSWETVSGGNSYTCALTHDGAAYCWGYNGNGQFGNGSTTSSSIPSAVSGGLTFQSIEAGSLHTCGITVSGETYCWGYNDQGQLGDGTTANSYVPVRGAAGMSFASISVGDRHTCGLTADGAAYCWGDNARGQLGDGTNISSTEPVMAQSEFPFQSIDAAYSTTCAVTTVPDVWCWGDNRWSQLGNGTVNTISYTPQAVVGALPLGSANTGTHTCGVTVDGAAYCWGLNASGELGDGTETNSTVPVAVLGGHSFAPHVETGDYHTCGVTTDGAAYCWGRFGYLGDGTSSSSSTPVAVVGGHAFQSVSLGLYQACGVTLDGAVYCWGDNDYGELGNGTTSPSTVPVRVVEP